VKYKGIQLDEGFRADLVVNKLVIIELKSIEAISNVHKKQIQTYLRLTGMKLGYLLNFGGELMKDGIVRAVNGLANEPLRASAPLREMHLSSAEQTGGTI
jgi:GxxExxY protein